MRSLLMMLTASLAPQGCAGRELETKVDMELVTRVRREKGETNAESFLRNNGPGTVTLLLEEQLSFVTAELRDDRGNLVPVRDGRARIGARHLEPPLRTVVLQPGQEVLIHTFSLMPSSSTAIAGSWLTWDLADVRSRTLALVTIYEMTEDALQRAKPLKAPDVITGSWRSAPVTIPFRKP